MYLRFNKIYDTITIFKNYTKMKTQTITKIFRSIFFSTIITLFLLFSGLNNYTTYATDSATVGAVVPNKSNNNGVIVINVDKSPIQNPSATPNPLLPSFLIDENKPSQSGSSEKIIENEKNPILQKIESGIDFLLPRTGGQSGIIGISLFLSIIGLLICISCFWKKN
jgi:hypothetical protein